MTTRHRNRRYSERGSLPLALLAAIIVAGLVVVLVARIIATQGLARFDEGFHASLQVADAGVNVGKFWLNNGTLLEGVAGTTGDAGESCDGPYAPRDFPIGCTTEPETREIDGSPYTFSLERLSEFEWEVISTGGRSIALGDDVERRVVAILTERPLVDVALFAETFINFSGNNAADSYTSNSMVPQDESWCTGHGMIATNGSTNFSGTSGGACHTLNRTIDGLHLHDWDKDDEASATDEAPGGDRCEHQGGGADGANCKEVSEEDPRYLAPQTYEPPLEYGTEKNIAFIDEALEACDKAKATIPGTYSTSSGIADNDRLNPGVIRSGTFEDGSIDFPGEVDGPFHCFESLYFDVNTEIDPVGNDPVILVVQNDVTLKGQAGKGDPAHVGCKGEECVAGDPTGDGASRPDASRLWIFTNGDVTFGNHSAFAGVMWAPAADCDGDAQAEIFGSLICGELPHNLGGWKFHYDEALANVSSGEFFASSWREEFLD